MTNLSRPHCLWLPTLVTVCCTAAPAMADSPEAERAQQIKAALASPPKPPEHLKPLSVVLLADEKDHGPAGNGAHDYPLWQKRWALLLGGKKASTEQQVNLAGPAIDDPAQFQGAPGVTVQTAQRWPSEEQFQKADVIVAYCYLLWTPERREQLRRYLEKGGGLVVIHAATWTKPKPSEEVADLLGVGGFRSWRHGTVRLEIKTESHSICRGLPRFVTLSDDEAYWPPAPAKQQMTVLAAVVAVNGSEQGFEKEGQPLFWSYSPGKGKVLGVVLGHAAKTFDDPFFRLLVLRGLAWAGGDFPYRLDNLALRGTGILLPR
ncbi:MAG: ThuA domain-containing protein [Planctomycetia bacterium]|nr:ThuA domain-containing protein [Planctomycetia bacterium]